MTGFLLFLTGPVAFAIGLLALTATIGRQLATEVPAGARGATLVTRATRASIPLVAVFLALIALRVLLLS